MAQNPPSRTKVAMVRGFTPTRIGRKAMRVTPLTGIVAQENLFAESHWMRNGSASRQICLDRADSSFLYSESVVADDTSNTQDGIELNVSETLISIRHAVQKRLSDHSWRYTCDLH
jgi:hypothetical protein